MCYLDLFLLFLFTLLSEGHFKHPQGFTQPLSRLKQLFHIINEIIESKNDFLIIAEMVKT